jgi:Domain of unknown function (DUF4936)
VREIYVYYRIRAADGAAATSAVTACHRALRARHPALRTRLLQRSEGTGDVQTWMEVYAIDGPNAGSGIDAYVLADIERSASAALAAWTDGERHTEVFEAVPLP